MANRILQNPIIAAVIDDLGGSIADADDLQRYLDFFRAQIGVNSATYADAAAQLAQARRSLAEALFAAAASLAPPESEEQQKTQLPAVMPESEAPKPEEEELEEVVAAVAAELTEVAARAAQVLLLQEEEERQVMVRVEMEDPVVTARAVEYLTIAVRVELTRQNHRDLVQAHAFLLLLRAAAFAITRAHLLPGVLFTIAAAYALAYAASGGAVLPGFASLLRISALVLCFLFGVPVVGNLA